MKEANAIQMAYLLGGILALIEDLGSPTCSYASYNVLVSHFSFLRSGVVGEGISNPNLTLSTLTCESTSRTTISSFLNH